METTGLADAIREVQRTAAVAATPTTIQVPADDGEGNEVKIPVLVYAAGDGRVTAQPMLDAMRAGSDWARQQRLANAEGPDFRVGIASHQALESFIAHANRFKAEHSAVWADAEQRRLVSVLDYHPAGWDSAARWGRHRGAYPCPLSEAWKAWGGGAALELNQDDFAALLDSRDRELVAGTLPSGKEAPAPAALITLANNLEVFSTATAKRERDPNTGRLKISYSEDKGVAGAIMPPPSFLVGIRVFQDARAQALEIRLRVTVDGGQACFEVQIHAAGDVLRDAFERLCERVAAETGLPVFIGTPE